MTLTIAGFGRLVEDQLNSRGAEAPHVWQVGVLADGIPGLCIMLEGMPPTPVVEIRKEDVGILVNTLGGLGSWSEWVPILFDYGVGLSPKAPNLTHMIVGRTQYSIVAQTDGALGVVEGWVS